ncbi:hypothetical protein F7R91_38845 [Streptomyces luteolifulvus]|uniref:Secreted protein n=1 Tax=Streptomyces luteolifulvus TaxID=2615112 RepID=A0A6H9UPK8_9ACTN|nr:hypothetical protein [Streptomyces luteolifulvus]KAB1139718.1 hypothetical protein F7R91_38845 [Streptomyces luteolifulvus]MXM63194.1 hypothetical protein [Streptomyces sp. HUCO-GS316]
MRLSRSLASATVAVALVVLLPYEAAPHARVKDGTPGAPRLFGAECRTTVRGSHVVAYCHNPYVDTDRVRLHIECARWWDLDTDGDPVDAGPAATVRLTGRCWKEVGSAWISHQMAS